MYLLSLFACVLFLAVGTSQKALETEEEDPRDCVMEFLDWCENRAHTSSGVGMISQSYFDNGLMSNINCRIDWEGTTCRLSPYVWYHCYPDQSLQYKGKFLTPKSEGDEDICATKDQAVRFVKQYQFNSTVFAKQFSKSMHHFNKGMNKMMSNIGNMLSSLSFPFSHWFRK